MTDDNPFPNATPKPEAPRIVPKPPRSRIARVVLFCLSAVAFAPLAVVILAAAAIGHATGAVQSIPTRYRRARERFNEARDRLGRGHAP
jgi:hypothetical protein